MPYIGKMSFWHNLGIWATGAHNIHSKNISELRPFNRAKHAQFELLELKFY
jgi:hypothetical protein